jgi:two-component system, OmpR family, sensor histidine kinase KdpD
MEPEVSSIAVTGDATPGHLTVYLGVAPAAGKTVAMLNEGQRRREQGADVVIAFVESHGRQVTDWRMAGLETVPRKTVDYRGGTFGEMDLDAVLRRRPQVALVDELAHTNVPGSCGNGKRWQDVLELLEAGIDVITNVNVQHLGSLAHTVEQIAGVPVRERVPDWVVRRAGRIELVDASPEQLRRRMAQGGNDPAGEALAHFFRVGNLATLRELALRFVAGRTAAGLRRVPERILVGVAPPPGTDAIIRSAAEMAAGIDAELDIVHVAPGDRDGQDLARLRQVASDVGASWHQLRDEDMAGALVEFARSRQVTRIVVGASQRSRWQEMISGGSFVQRVARLAAQAGIDVYIVAPHQSAGHQATAPSPGAT